jgi:hypothetical protein
MAPRRWARRRPFQHPQQYEPLETANRRRAQGDEAAVPEGVLSWENTAPLRIHTDLSGLYEETAVEHSICFKENAWFKWNFPESASPPCSLPDWRAGSYCRGGEDGHCMPCGARASPICDRGVDASMQNCWGVCTADDVLLPEMRSWMVARIAAAVNESQSFFRVRSGDPPHPRPAHLPFLWPKGQSCARPSR